MNTRTRRNFLARLLPTRRCSIMKGSRLTPSTSELQVAINKVLTFKESQVDNSIVNTLAGLAGETDKNLIPPLGRLITGSNDAYYWAEKFGGDEIIREKITNKPDVEDWLLFINPEDYGYFLQKAKENKIRVSEGNLLSFRDQGRARRARLASESS